MPSGRKWYPAIAALGGTLTIASCAMGPPTGPAVVAVPAQGKDLAAFQKEYLLNPVREWTAPVGSGG